MQKIHWSLILVPVALAVRYLAASHETLIFVLAAIAMIPLAKLLSDSTEQTAYKTGPTLGALLNVTFGNAGELLIGFFALKAGLQQLVKASITGSILVNLLLTLGISMLAGGIRKKTLSFNPLSARTQTTMLGLAAISLVLPAAFSLLGGAATGSGVRDLSLEFSIVLAILYGLSLLFTLHTHEQLLTPHKAEEGDAPEGTWSTARALTTLVVSAALVAWMGEVLVGSIEAASRSLGMTELFAGLVVVAIAGNAAEATAAVRAALNNRMDLSVGIAAGSSIQVALFVAPLLVIISQWVSPRPMDLVFTPVEIVALVLAVVITSQVASDGQSNWLEGAQLLAVYVMLAVMFFYLPAGEPAKSGH